MDLKTFIRNQFIENEFNRVDMLVRYHSIKEYLLDENYNFEIYKKMQARRKFRNKYINRKILESFVNKQEPPGFFEELSVSNFKALISSFKEKGFDSVYPIRCNENGNLLDGSHRLALSYFYKLDEIPVFNISTTRQPKYSIKWFEENGFSDKDMLIINNEIDILKNYINFNDEKIL